MSLTPQQVANLNRLMTEIDSNENVGPYPTQAVGEYYHCAGNRIIWVNKNHTLKQAVQIAFTSDPKTWGHRTFPTFVRRPDRERILAEHYGLTAEQITELHELDFKPLPSHEYIGRAVWLLRMTEAIGNIITDGTRNAPPPPAPAAMTSKLPSFQAEVMPHRHDQASADETVQARAGEPTAATR